MPFEDRIAQSLHETGEEFAPRDLSSLVNGGVADGRKRQRRRRVAVLGGSAALALVAVGGALVPSALGGAANRDVAGPAAQPGMSLAGSTKPVGDGEQAKALLKALEGVLPAGGEISGQRASWQSKPPVPGKNVIETASLVYNDGKGAAGISVSLTRYRVNARQLPTCEPKPAVAPNDVCHTYQTPGGGRLVVDLGYEYPAKGTGTKSWTAWLTMPDGSFLEFNELNAVQEKDSAVTRQTPPLTADQLRKAALSDVWAPLLAQIPAPTGHPTGAPSAKPSQQVTPSH